MVPTDETGVAGLLLGAAARHPDAPALVESVVSLTFSDLHARSVASPTRWCGWGCVRATPSPPSCGKVQKFRLRADATTP